MEPSSDKATFRQVLARQQARLERLLRWLLTYQGGDSLGAAAVFSAFADQLRCRIDVEDRIVFPAFEEEAGLRHEGPTKTLRRDHREIERRLDVVEQRLAGGATLPEMRNALAALAVFLGEHFRLDELILNGISSRLTDYPALADAVCELELYSDQP